MIIQKPYYEVDLEKEIPKFCGVSYFTYYPTAKVCVLPIPINLVVRFGSTVWKITTRSFWQSCQAVNYLKSISRVVWSWVKYGRI